MCSWIRISLTKKKNEIVPDIYGIRPLFRTVKVPGTSLGNVVESLAELNAVS